MKCDWCGGTLLYKFSPPTTKCEGCGYETKGLMVNADSDNMELVSKDIKKMAKALEVNSSEKQNS